ncbi:MAG: formate--tetrahydrofolate ligase [Thermoplasmatota archaeon]
MKTDIEIAQEARVRSICDVASGCGVPEELFESCGRQMGKLHLELLERLRERPDGKLIWVSAITPTPAGEGKTVTTIGLVQALGTLGRRAVGTLRQPSLAPVFGVKGGATGGGYAQVYPMWDINLHFTGDIHAVGAAHNLLSAMVENHLFWGNELNIDPDRVLLRKVIDVSARELRTIQVGLGRRGGVPHESGFDITAASEVSAILALSSSLPELKERLSRIVVAYTRDGRPVTAEQMGCVGAMALLLKDALKPNLVQTLEGHPVLVHGFPFANIAHGNNSVLALRMALKLGDYVVTEAGFGADLGLEKAFHIVCRVSGLRPDCVVLVASIRALKMHGGVPKGELDRPDPGAVERGFANLDRHLETIRKFNVPVVVAINRFPSDTMEEVGLVLRHCESAGARAAVSTVHAEGGRGGVALARAVLETMERERADLRFLYDLSLPIKEKIRIIATEVYGAGGVAYTERAERELAAIEGTGHDGLPICMAKTQLSVTDDPSVKGAPRGWTLTVREVRLSSGAGFIVPITGEMMTVPGLPASPAAEKMDIDERGRITGLS